MKATSCSLICLIFWSNSLENCVCNSLTKVIIVKFYLFKILFYLLLIIVLSVEFLKFYSDSLCMELNQLSISSISVSLGVFFSFNSKTELEDILIQEHGEHSYQNFFEIFMSANYIVVFHLSLKIEHIIIQSHK